MSILGVTRIGMAAMTTTPPNRVDSMECRHGGDLRLFAVPPPWQADYADTLGDLVIFGESAIGHQFCRSPDGLVTAMDPETRALEHTGDTVAEFLAMVERSPEWTLDGAFTALCRAAHGPPGDGQRFAFVVPIAIGGRMDVGNVHVVDAAAEMRWLASLSTRFKDDPPGTPYHPVRIDLPHRPVPGTGEVA